MDRYKLSDVGLTAPAENRKGVYQGDGVRGTVAGLALNTDGQPVAVDVADRGAAIQNLSTGEVTTVDAKFAHVRDAAVGTDGELYLLAYAGEAVSEPELYLVRYDLDTLEMQGDWPTGQHLDDDILHTALLPVSGESIVASVVRGRRGPVRLDLVALDHDELTTVPSLPEGIGLRVAPADDGSIYIYGGPARNQVTRVDLRTGKLEPSFSGLVPDDAYVDAIETTDE